MSDSTPAKWYEQLLGDTLAERYQVDAHLDEGGFGAVFTGTDLRLERPVAIKFLTKLGANPEHLFTEARRLARLSHPGILLVFDYGTHKFGVSSLPYLVMELLPGETLANLRDQYDGHLPIEQAVPVLANVLEALEHTHRAGIVHRDLHPGNVMLDRLGNPKLVDFGLSKADDGQRRTTTTGLLSGVPGYIAPERYKRSFEPSIPEDPRSDLWSVGVMLFDLCTGQLPWDGSPEILTDVSIKDPHKVLSSTLR